MNKDTIRITTKVILHAGNARSRINSALIESDKNNVSEANQLLKEAEEEINSAHTTQTEIIQSEARGEQIEFSILLSHAQDTLMAAITELNMAKHIMALNEKIAGLEK